MEELGIILLLALIILAICIYFIKDKNINWSSATDIFKQNIYLDNNGTTKICPEALETYNESIGYGNASSSYATQAKEIIKKSDDLIKFWVQSPNYNVIYTGGASESNDTIVKSIAENRRGAHVVMSSYEHSSILDCAKKLSSDGSIRLTLIDPSIYGFINPQDVFNAVGMDTVLVSIMHVNNELGNVNDIQKICQAAKSKNPNVYFHTDLVQSFGKYSIPLQNWGIDAASVSCHKFYGPQGVGYLIVNPNLFKEIQQHPLIYGSQNQGARGGTTNISGINSAYTALSKVIQNRSEKNNKLLTMKKYLINCLTQYPIGDYQKYANQPDSFVVLRGSTMDVSRGSTTNNPKNEIIFLGEPDPQLSDMTPNTLLFSIVKYGPMEKHFCNVQLKKDLLDRGVIISIGSACHSESPEPSHVLYSIKAPYCIRCGVIRVSFGDYNNMCDVKKFCKKLSECIELQNK